MVKKLAVIALALLLTGADYLGGTRLQRSEKAMGSFFEITVYESPLKDAELANLVSNAFKIVTDLENKLSSFKDSSIIAEINRAKAGEVFELDEDTFEVLQKSLWTAEVSGGAYDITLWPLKTLWKNAKVSATIPSSQAVESALPKVGYQYILLDASTRKASLSKEGVQIDLGGIGKGYAVEKAAVYLAKNGVSSGIVNAGGNLRLIGDPPTNAGWRIGIEHPRNLEGYAATLLVDKDLAISTSGDYQDFFYHKNRRYSHILDPRTGFPVTNGIVSVTIIAKDAFTADALDTAFFVMGPEKGFEMIERLKDQGVEAIVVQELPNGKLSLAGSFGAMSLVQEVAV